MLDIVWLGPTFRVNEVFSMDAILPETDCVAAAVCSCVTVLLGSVTGIAQTTATRIRLAIADKMTFSSFFILKPSWRFSTGAQRTADGAPPYGGGSSIVLSALVD